ncbi:MAG: FMN-binding glutamate synthase family protein [Alphaproteobacteria bacterium]|nr:FMN-binding glutamate synthase family protein [Alphaproteobacteria bacterium]MCB9794236.1 FMN-binding glutamate synthase family protein [Alphaproteobacteria bacterium]
MLQTEHTIRRNFPVIGNFRYMFEAVRPEMHQYFIETDHNGTPFSREQRSVVYQRAKDVLDTAPFGTRHDVYGEGYQWIEHSLRARPAPDHPPRIRVGGPETTQPYSASLLNISAMSYGSLSSVAVLALNGGAKDGGFAHNTGEGGLSPYHLEPGGDVIWQLGTGYFGARGPDGRFSPEAFTKRASHANVKMIEVKLSQGAKPGHGGILPAAKVTQEISDIRGVPLGQDVLSPPAHSAFNGPTGLLEFVSELRSLSGGKPVGFKLCIGRRQEFYAICKAMLETGITPDYIAVDGGEGGTGAAPLEFSNSIGWPLLDALTQVHGALRGIGLRDQIKIIASGRVITGFDMAVRLALGADLCYSARGMMFALGCIQALRCNNNSCPTGVATQDPSLMRGLVVPDKRRRVYNFHHKTVHSLLEIVAAAGLDHPDDLHPSLIHRRVSGTETHTLDVFYKPLEEGMLLEGEAPADVLRDWEAARPDRF